jgi:hypothetical protein
MTDNIRGFVMLAIQVSISQFVDDYQPGWVECVLIDAWGQPWTFIEKVPVVTTADLGRDSAYPQPGAIACHVVERSHHKDKEIVTVNTQKPWAVESTTGFVEFDILPEQLIEI